MEIEKMTTNGEDDQGECSEFVCNDAKAIEGEDIEIISKWFERATSMMTESKSVELEEAFQSTSTSKYLESRFFMWNNVGAIRCYSE